jgi:serine protease AprX
MRLLGAVVLATMLFAGSLTASATTNLNPKIGTQLNKLMDQNKSGGIYDILIYLDDEADLSNAANFKSKNLKGAFVYEALTAKAASTQGPLKKFLNERNIEFRSYFITNMIAAYSVSRDVIEQLATKHTVRQVLGNPVIEVLKPLTASQTEQDKFIGVGANITRTGAPQVWSELGVQGEGIVVANQDTGFDWDHESLKSQYRGWNGSSANHDYNWHDAIRTGSNSRCGISSREPCDDHGHGTHTLGTSVGDDGAGNQIGMAPKSKWIGCRNMNAGNGRPSTYIECFEFFIAPWPYNGNPQTEGDPSKAAHVINNSWGCPSSEGCEGSEFIPVLESLKAAGIMVVAAAGNAGSSCGSINDGPAHHTDLVFSVGAVDHRNDRIAGFSSRGPSSFDNGVGPDLSAPGVSVRSASKGGGYVGNGWSGTSMASPHVAGAVALLWSADASLIGDIDATSDLLRGTSEGQTSSQSCAGRSGQQVPNNTFGHGIMNVYDSVKTRL